MLWCVVNRWGAALIETEIKNNASDHMTTVSVGQDLKKTASRLRLRWHIEIWEIQQAGICWMEAISLIRYIV